jgi:hypothetical protein
VLGRDPDGGDVTGMVGLEQPDYKAGHRAVLGNYPIRNGFRRREQILERVATVRFAVNKATLIQAPALVDLGNGERTKIVTRINGWYQRDVGWAFGRWRLAAIKPPPRAKFFENCHKPIANPLRELKSVAQIISCYPRPFTSVALA